MLIGFAGEHRYTTDIDTVALDRWLEENGLSDASCVALRDEHGTAQALMVGNVCPSCRNRLLRWWGPFVHWPWPQHLQVLADGDYEAHDPHTCPGR